MHKAKKKNIYFLTYIRLILFKKTYKSSDVDVKVDNNGTFWLNEKHKEERLHHKNLTGITIKYHSHYRKPTIPHKIFGTKWNNPVKLDRRRKV